MKWIIYAIQLLLIGFMAHECKRFHNYYSESRITEERAHYAIVFQIYACTLAIMIFLYFMSFLMIGN